MGSIQYAIPSFKELARRNNLIPSSKRSESFLLLYVDFPVSRALNKIWNVSEQCLLDKALMFYLVGKQKCKGFRNTFALRTESRMFLKCIWLANRI